VLVLGWGGQNPIMAVEMTAQLLAGIKSMSWLYTSLCVRVRPAPKLENLSDECRKNVTLERAFQIRIYSKTFTGFFATVM